jgi:hypothetical protein
MARRDGCRTNEGLSPAETPLKRQRFLQLHQGKMPGHLLRDRQLLAMFIDIGLIGLAVMAGVMSAWSP